MPSYYDSRKKNPGKAEVKYKKGGKVRYAEGGKTTIKKAGGGQLKITGMGAATRGGNFTRNG